MFSMKTHKVISKTIQQHILYLRHEYFSQGNLPLPKATCLPCGTIFSLGQPTSPKDFPTFSTVYESSFPQGEIMSPLENSIPFPRKCLYSFGLMHLHIRPCNHYFIHIYLLLQCCHIVDKYIFVGLFKSLDLTSSR
jgi:hypothetical protein